MKKICILLTCSMALLSAGCSYNMGSIANPQVKTIAIAPIKNKTYFANVSEYMRQALSEAFQVDSSYKVQNIYNADCILYGRITDITIAAADIRSANTGTTFMTQEYKMTLHFEFTVVIPGQAAPLINTTQITGTAEYQVPVDQFISQESGIQQAAWNAANNVVRDCTEVW